MKIIKGDIWRFLEKPDTWVGIPTNGYVKNDGTLVMGRGLALQAAKKYPDLPRILGEHINTNGNTVCLLPKMRLFTFPVKYVWWDNADLNLIEQSAQQLCDHFIGAYNLGADFHLYLPKVGCGNGKLEWKDVEPIIRAYLGEMVTIVDWK